MKWLLTPTYRWHQVPLNVYFHRLNRLGLNNYYSRYYYIFELNFSTLRTLVQVGDISSDDFAAAFRLNRCLTYVVLTKLRAICLSMLRKRLVRNLLWQHETVFYYYYYYYYYLMYRTQKLSITYI